VDVLGALTDGSVPRAFDTDVNAPALAEFKFNHVPHQTSVVYITVGTGIGVGVVVNGKTVHGRWGDGVLQEIIWEMITLRRVTGVAI
jgi:predicted NBD/HSP70 family sugar kinase